MAHGIVHNYLKGMTTPLTKMKAQYNSCRNNGVNHCVKESSLPARLALCIGAKVMLIKNYIVEWKLMNGSVGTVVDIVYENADGPNNENTQPAYVVVDFPYSCIPPQHKIIPNKPSTCIPIPVSTDQCDKKCCSVTMIPLIPCVAITIHKAQGMTVGPNQIFEKVIVYLPEDNQRKSPGLELVAFSRATDPNSFAIGNNSSKLSIMSLRKIGNTPAYQL